jgi:adhesin transport system outer membrane protein
MKTTTLTAVGAAVLFLSGLPATAQTLPAPLVEAARKAVVSNPEVQARWHAFKGSDAERDVAKSAYYPQIDVNAGVGREWQKRPGTPQIDYTHSQAGIQLNQMLFDGFFARNEVARLDRAKLVRYYELMDASENAALEALRAYADVARYSELVEQAKANYVEHKLTAQQLTERTDAGVTRRVDLEQANGRLALAESNLLTEISNLHDVSARYLRIVGDKPPAQLPPVSPAAAKLGALPASPAEAMKSGLATNPALNAAYENVRAAKLGIETSKAGYMPRVDFRVRQSWDRNLDGVKGGSRDAAVELLLNYNLYRGGADKARETQAVEFHNQARSLQEKACRDARQTLAIAYNDSVRLTEQLGYLEQHRLSTEKAREAYRQQFDIGQRTLLDLLDTQNEYFESGRAYTNAFYEQFIAQARTLAVMGKLVPVLNVARADVPSAKDAGQDREGGLDPAELCPFDTPVVLQIDKSKAVSDAPARARPAAPAAVARPAAPAAAAVPAATKTTFAADALFDFDKSVIKPEGQAKLAELAGKIKGINLEVAIAIGHTDGVGSDAYNQRLSLARANAVKAYLVSQGIDANRIKTEGRGKSQPVADNATAEGRAKNRRVEIDVVAGPARK